MNACSNRRSSRSTTPFEDLAKGTKIPYENLKATIDAFNEAVKSKNDPQLGRYINNDQVPMVDGPWYAGLCQPKVHHCMGGLLTDETCRVLDVRTDKPIKNLFAAGEATGGVHGAVRLEFRRHSRLPGLRPHRRPAGR